MVRGVKGGGEPEPDEVKFERLVDRSGDCHLWLGSGKRYGYFRTKRSGEWRSERVNRLALEWKLGRPLHPGMNANHTCHNDKCVNPEHLYEGTQCQNVHDMLAAGRHLKPNCPNGHPYTPENLLPDGYPGRRKCRQCRNEASRRHRRESPDNR